MRRESQAVCVVGLEVETPWTPGPVIGFGCFQALCQRHTAADGGELRILVQYQEQALCTFSPILGDGRLSKHPWIVHAQTRHEKIA